MKIPRKKRLFSGMVAVGLACGLSGCASPPARRFVHAPGAAAPIAPYTPAVVVGNSLWVSGQIGINPATGQLAEGTEAQARQALDNVKVLVEAAGFELSDVVQCQVFLIDMKEYEAFNAVYATYFPKNPPARALVQVAALPRGARVEVLATAVR